MLTAKDRFTCTEDEVVHGKTRVGTRLGEGSHAAICFSPGQVQLPSLTGETASYKKPRLKKPRIVEILMHDSESCRVYVVKSN